MFVVLARTDLFVRSEQMSVPTELSESRGQDRSLRVLGESDKGVGH